MRPLEIVGFVCALVPVLAWLAVLPVSIGRSAAAFSCGVLIFAALRFGAYWQLFPLYLAAALGLATLLFPARSSHHWFRIAVPSAVVCLLIMTAAFSFVLPMFRLPEPTGAYAVGTRIVPLVDPVRMETHVPGLRAPREIIVQIWYPANPDGQQLASYRRRIETTWLSSYMGVLWTHSYLDAPVATEGGPYPVLLFNPAWQGQRTQNTYQTEDLASHGFIVVAIDHTYNSGPVALPDGRVIRTVKVHDITDFQHTTVAQQVAIGDDEVRIQAGDDILALNYLTAANGNPRSPWFQHVNANDAGAFGHSFGGAVSAEACYRDPRIRAAINEDGWMFGEASTHGLRKPFLVMYEDEPVHEENLKSADVQTRREAELDAIDAVNVRQTMREYGGYVLTIQGSRHNNFRDRSLYSPLRRLSEAGKISPRRAHRIVEEYTLQFFSHYLLNKPAPLLAANGSPFKEVQFENWFAKNAVSE